MAKATRSKSKDTAQDLRQKIIDATLSAAATHGWRDLTLRQVAAAADMPVSDVIIAFPNKYKIINAFQDGIDAAVLKATATDSDEPVRDRLFDVMMERFEQLVPYRDGLAEIAKDSLLDPFSGLAFLPRMARSMSRMLEAAGVSASGLSGELRMKGLALVYADAFRIWLKDDSPDLGKTMAALDKGLGRAEQMARALSQGPGTRPPWSCRKRQSEHADGA